MLFNTASILVGGLAALMALPEVAAGGLGLRLGLLGNWDCDLLGFRKPEIPSCTGAGFFYFKIDGKPCCVSPHTRVPPPDHIPCPVGWSVHKKYPNKCIPPSVKAPCDCREGSYFHEGRSQCVPYPNTCKPGHFWSERARLCCPDNKPPPETNCPDGCTCPTNGWYWNPFCNGGKGGCLPLTPWTCEPDCPNWNPEQQCCGGHGPQPSKGYGHKDKSSPHRGWWKRDQSSQEAFPHALYCGEKKACSINVDGGDTWSYECLDTDVELESCGGCVADGEGQNCLDIPNVALGGVTCSAGRCVVSHCQRGFEVVNGTSCQA